MLNRLLNEGCSRATHRTRSQGRFSSVMFAEEGQRLLEVMERSVVRPAIEITYLRLLREIKLYPRKPEVAKAFEADTTDFKKL